MTLLDIDLSDARRPSASPKKREGKGIPLHSPKPDVPMLYQNLDHVRSSIACSDWKSAAYYSVQVANIYADLSQEAKTAIDVDFRLSPDPYGDWSSVSWMTFCVWLVFWREGLVPEPQFMPFDAECPPRISLVHGRGE